MIGIIKRYQKYVVKKTLEAILALSLGAIPLAACDEEHSSAVDAQEIDAGSDYSLNRPLPEFCSTVEEGTPVCCDNSELASYWNQGTDEVAIPIAEEGLLLTDTEDEHVYLPGGAKIIGFDSYRNVVFFYTQDEATWDRGICQPASIYCDTGTINPETGFAVWRNRAEERLPQSSDGCDGLDNDCNGEVDYFEARYCSNPLPEGIVGQDEVKESLCTAGEQLCIGGELQECVGRIDYRTPEICDLLDNDCDGEIDEPDVGQPYYWGRCGDSDSGICRYGANDCIDGEIICRSGNPDEDSYVPIRPQDVDLCDRLDNDCDIEVDEDHVILSCINECGQPGAELCIDGALFCYAEEVCNDVDDDCNGLIDGQEGLNCECDPYAPPSSCIRPTILDTGVVSSCGYGFSSCDENREPTGCVIPTFDDLITYLPEICDNYDQDCDNLIDEDEEGNPLMQECYTGPLGTVNVGECSPGIRECVNGTFDFSPCVGQRVPERYESCDSIVDKNCDGEVGFVPLYDEECIQLLINFDKSISMDDYIDAVRNYFVDLFNTLPSTQVQIAATTFGDDYNNSTWGYGAARLAFNFTDLSAAIPLLNAIVANGSGHVEPQLDVHYMGLQPDLQYISFVDASSQVLAWNPECFKAMITVGNEGPQTNYFSGTPEAANACSMAATSCPWPGCDPSEPAEVFFIVQLYDEWLGGEYVVYRDAVPNDGVQRVYDLETTIESGEMIELPDVLDSLRCQSEDD